MFPENDFNLRPGSLAHGPKAKSTSTKVGHIWDRDVKCDGERHRERGQAERKH